MADPSWLINKLSNPDYNNWVKGNLILLELKTGLVPFLDDKAKDLQQYVLRHVAASGTVCTVCTGADLRRGRYICPSAGICTTILQSINTEYTHHPPGTVKLMNTDTQAWCDPARYWEIAKAYISTAGYASKTSAAETDVAGLLAIIINCKWIQSFLSVSPGVFQQVKHLRNVIMHSEKPTLAADQLDKLFYCCIQILQDRHVFAADSTAQAALARITEIRDLETQLVSQLDPTVSHVDTHVSSSEARNTTDRIPMTKDPWAGLISQQTPREPFPSNQPTQNHEESFPEYSMTRKPRGPRAGLIPQQTHKEPLPSNQPTQNQEELFPEYSMTRKPLGPRAGLIPQQTHREPLPSNQPTQHQEELFPEYSMTRKPLDSLLLLYAELKDKLRRDQCRAIAKEISAERHLPAEEKASFQKMTKRRDLVDWVLKYVLKQKDKMIFKIFCESLGKQSPSLGQTLQETPVNKHELMKTERQPTTLQLDDLHFLQSSFNSKLVVDIIIDKLLSQFLITVEEHSSIRNSSDVSEMTKRLEALLQCDKEIMQQFKLITQSFRNASVSETAGWLVPLHAQAKQTLSCDKGLAIATDIYQQIPGIMSPSDLYELYDLIDNSSDVIDRLLKHIYRHPRPEVFDVICYSLEDHDEELYEHFLRLFFFKGCDKEKARPVVNKDSALPSGSGADYLYHILRSRQTLDVVIDHLLSSFCITVDQHSDIRDAVSIKHSITKLVELLEQSPQTIVAVNAILRHLDKVADTKNTGDKEITISVDFGDSEVNSQAKNYMNSLCGQTLPLADIGQFYLNDVIDGSVVIKVSPLDRESLIRFRDMETEGTILEYLSDHIEVFLPDDVEIELSELSIGVKEETTGVPVQSESIINATIQLSSGEVYKMENEPFVQASFQKYSKSIEDIRMCPKELLSRKTESNSLDRGLVFAGRFGSEKGEPLAIKRMLLRNYSGSLKTYETVKERLQHSNIVKIFCVEQDRRYGYVAMELMDETLVEYVVRSCPNGNTAMGTEKEIDYMKHIVTGLAFIHEEGFLHNMFSQGAILLKKKKKDIHPKQLKIACFSDAALCELVPVSCSKGTNDVLALIKVLLFVLNKEEKHVNDVILPDNRIIQSGHFDIFVLLQEILDSRQSDELNLQEFAFHPALSRPSVQLQFLEKSHKLRSELRVDFNSTNRTSVNSMNPWLYEPPLTSNVYQYLISEALHRKYKPHSMNCLVRCIRNCHEHLHNIIPQVQMEFGPRERYIYYWLVKFPGLVSSVYEAMRPHKNHTELIRFFTIES